MKISPILKCKGRWKSVKGFRFLSLSTRWFALLLITLSTQLVVATASAATTFVVDSALDTLAKPDRCTLRNAIIAANTDAPSGGCPAGNGEDTITFAAYPESVISIDSDLPIITDSLTILGKGRDHTIISGFTQLPLQGGNMYHVIKFAPPSNGKSLILKGLRIRDSLARGNPSNASGGCISIIGSHEVVLDHVDLFACEVQGSGSGGGLFFQPDTTSNKKANLLIQWSKIFGNNHAAWTGNSGSHVGLGGGIAISGPLDVTIKNVDINSNYAGTGGGIYMVGESVGVGSVGDTLDVNITRSLIRDNKVKRLGNARSKGAGIYISDATNSPLNTAHISVDIEHTSFLGNELSYEDGDGAGIFLQTFNNGANVSLNLANTNFQDNYVRISDVVLFIDDVFITPVGTNPATVTTGGYNFITAVTDILLVSPWISANFGAPNALHDFFFVSDSGSSGLNPNDYTTIDQGSCGSEPYDFYGNGSSFGPPSVRAVNDVAITDYDDGCDIGGIELGGVSVSDYDNDGVVDGADVFPIDPNETIDTDGDHIGNNADTDDDADGTSDANDCAPLDDTAWSLLNGYLDADGDNWGIGSSTILCTDNSLPGGYGENHPDNCPSIPNPGQGNNDNDSQGDICDLDDDNDTVLDLVDNCPFVANLDQADANGFDDGDGQGDACENKPEDDWCLPLITNAGAAVICL